MPRQLIYLTLCMAMIISSCQSEPFIDTFDSISWKNDTNGCQGDRLNQIGIIMEEQQQLLGWSESKITAYLGAPDYLEIFVRSQKFLIYYLEPTRACGQDGKMDPLRLYIRMDALGDSKELSLKNL